MKRITGMVLTLLMLHAIGAQAQLLCASDVEAMAVHPDQHAGHDAPPAHDTPPSSEEEEAPLPECCMGMASCTPSWYVHAGTTSFAESFAIPAHKIPLALPISTIPTPEPPPPKR